MRFSCCQSNYIPWRGYLDLIRCSDIFIIHDDIQFTKQDWRNRNKIRTDKGSEWLTVPVRKAPTNTNIDRIEIAGEDWRDDHSRKLRQHLGKARYFEDAIDLWEKGTEGHKYLSLMNVDLIVRVCRYLDIQTRIIMSSTLDITGHKTERLIQMAKMFDAKTYISGPAAKCYLDVDAMKEIGCDVEWKEYNYFPYPQTYPGFFGFVTVLDLIANLGPEAKNHIQSMSYEEMAPG